MSHITSERLEDLLEQFMHENPYGDSRELAEFMFNQGWESGMSSTCNLFSSMKYDVEITRISYATITFTVEASSEEEAKDLAMDEAYNTSFDEDTAEYEIDGVYESEEDEEEE